MKRAGNMRTENPTSRRKTLVGKQALPRPKHRWKNDYKELHAYKLW
jgi:hypothetical protein